MSPPNASLLALPVRARWGYVRGVRRVGGLPDGVLFGATVLGTPELHTPLSRGAMRANNRKGIFSNRGDTEGGLRGILDESFETVGIEIVGTVAVFAATGPRLPRA